MFIESVECVAFFKAKTPRIQPIAGLLSTAYYSDIEALGIFKEIVGEAGRPPPGVYKFFNERLRLVGTQ